MGAEGYRGSQRQKKNIWKWEGVRVDVKGKGQMHLGIDGPQCPMSKSKWLF